MTHSKPWYSVSEITAIAAATATGFLVWALAPRLVGTSLPWDASWPFYSLSMGVTGLVASRLSAHVWICVAASWLAQIVALVILPLDRSANMLGVEMWWVFGVIATGFGSLIVAAGWVLGRGLLAWLGTPRS